MVKILLLLACGRSGPPPALTAPVSATLRSEGIVGALQIDPPDCRIGIWGPAFATGGDSLVGCEATREEGDVWLYFPLRSGAGEGQAAARLEAQTLVLPLGARSGEFERRLTMEKPPLGAEDRAAAAARSAEAMASAQEGWAAGRFRLMDGERLVGELSLPATAPAEIAVYDASWLTPQVTVAEAAQDGPDIVVRFPVTPSFHGELGMLRINRLTRQVVVPLGPEPTPDDRQLRLDFGAVEEAERQAARDRALMEAGRREQEVSVAVAQRIAAEATAAGACSKESTTWASWGLALQGYRVELADGDGGCVVSLEPELIQHGRRLSARVDPSGVLEETLHPVW
ncbi:MAG: hypothetical protein H6739_01610 [Alphaproteobacteria bacterium]|nr:hypothetical protein [Alphaproteobacteria bacterium]